MFKNATGHTRNGLLGLAFHKDPTLAVPKKLEYLQDNANGSGVSIYQHSQGTLEKVLEAGRHGLYVDYHQDDGIGGHSVILSYCAEDIINWRTGMVNGHSVLTLVVLRESPEIPEGFGYKTARAVPGTGAGGRRLCLPGLAPVRTKGWRPTGGHRRIQA